MACQGLLLDQHSVLTYTALFGMDDGTGILMMDGHAANVVAIRAIQELTSRTEAQEKRIKALEAQLQQQH